MPTHKFSIIDDINNPDRYLDYDCEKYNYVNVHDDIILDMASDLTILPTYFHELSRPSYSLAYYGITLIPPNSLKLFAKIADEHNQKELSYLIDQSIKEDKYIIHFGI